MTNLISVNAEFGDARIILYNTTDLKEDLQPNLSLHYHSHNPCYEIHTVRSGEIIISFLDKEIKISSGELLVIPPGRGHFSCRKSRNDTENLILFLNVKRISGEDGYYDYFKSSLNSLTEAPLKISKGLIENIYDFINSYNKMNLRNKCIIKATAYSIVTGLFDAINQFKADLPMQNVSQADNEQKLILLDNLLSERGYSVSDIAQKMGYSKRHISRLIQQIYAKSLNEIRNEQTLSSAKKLLKENSEMPLSKVAELSGFLDTATMRNAFIKRENCSPSEYRAKDKGELK